MIRINLLGDKVDNRAMVAASSTVYFGSILATLAFCFILHSSLSSKLNSLKSEKGNLQVKLSKLQAQTVEVKNLEEKRATLKEKLTTIATLKARKQGPVHVLYDINISVPERAWLEKIDQVESNSISIEGVAIDDQTVSEFMKKLESSESFNKQKVELVHTTQMIQEDNKLKRFGLSVGVKSFLTPEARMASESNKAEAVTPTKH